MCMTVVMVSLHKNRALTSTGECNTQSTDNIFITSQKLIFQIYRKKCPHKFKLLEKKLAIS